MAKLRDEYPHNKTMNARLTCLIQSHANLRSLVRGLRGFFEKKPEVLQMIDEAMATAIIAGWAISGRDEGEVEQ